MGLIEGARFWIGGELLAFLWQNKWWWLTSMILTLLIIGGLVLLVQSSVTAPFIYTLF